MGNREIKNHIDRNVNLFNGHRGNPESFKYLDKLLSKQFFRLSFWKVAAEEINYRRFFNINELISLKIEDESVFAHTHSLLFELGHVTKTPGEDDPVSSLYSFLQNHFNLRRGLFAFATLEAYQPDLDENNFILRVGPGLQFFPMQRLELRADLFNTRRFGESAFSEDTWDLLAQLHVWL